jgi:hypothetical protein
MANFVCTAVRKSASGLSYDPDRYHPCGAIRIAAGSCSLLSVIFLLLLMYPDCNWPKTRCHDFVGLCALMSGNGCHCRENQGENWQTYLIDIEPFNFLWICGLFSREWRNLLQTKEIVALSISMSLHEILLSGECW